MKESGDVAWVDMWLDWWLPGCILTAADGVHACDREV